MQHCAATSLGKESKVELKADIKESKQDVKEALSELGKQLTKMNDELVRLNAVVAGNSSKLDTVSPVPRIP